MKNKFKKLTSLLLASIMMLVALPIQTLAAEWGKGDTVYAAMIGDFVGSDGKTYADKYNYDYIYYKSDGSIGKATRYASTHAKLGVSKNGIIQPAICIEAGVAYNTGSSYVGEGNNNTYLMNLPYAIRRDLKIALLCGFNSDTKSSPVANTNLDDFWFATQAVSWEIQQDLRTGYGKSDLAVNSIIPNTPKTAYYDQLKGRPAEKCYEYILNKMKAYSLVPSFTGRAKATAPTHTMKYNSSTKKYSITLTDENNSNMPASAFNISGVTVTKSGNKYTFSTTTKISGTKACTYKANRTSGDQLVIWKSGNGSQTMAAGIDDPVQFYANFKTESTGTAQIKKVWEHNHDTSSTKADNSDIYFTIKNSSGLAVKATGKAGSYTYSTSGSVSQFKLNSSNTFLVKSLPAGTYTVTEHGKNSDGSIPYYTRTGGVSKTVTVTAGGTGTVTFKNTRNTGTGKVIKTWIDTNGNAIAASNNVERNKQIYFRIKNADGKYITVNGTKYSGSYTFTGTSTKATSLYVNPGTGTFTVSDLPTGKYTVYEYGSPDGYSVNRASQTITISRDKTSSVSFVNSEDSGTAQIKKVWLSDTTLSASEKANLEKNVYFTVKDANGKYIKVTGSAGAYVYAGTQTSANNMKLSGSKFNVSKLPMGTYTVTEINNASGYNPKTQTKTVTIANKGETKSVSFTNKSTPVVVIRKHFSDENNLTEAQLKEQCTITISNIRIGDYKVTEVKTGKTVGYITENSKDLEVKTDTVTTVNFENKPYANIVINKVDSVKGTALSGATFGIYTDAECEIPAQAYTSATDDTLTDAVITESATGKYTCNFLPIESKNGTTYYVKELSAPDHYAIDTDVHPVTLKTANSTVAVSNNATSKFYETPLGSVRTTKVDADHPDVLLSGAEFTVYNSDKATVYGKLAETSKGTYQLDEIPAGTYYLKETKAPKYYNIDNTFYQFTISDAGKVVDVSINGNDKFPNAPQKGDIKIVKRSADGVLSGWKFEVSGTALNGTPVATKTYTTDAKGEINISNLLIGTYTVKEVKDGKTVGYITPANQTIEVKSNATTTATFENKPFGHIVINKIDAKTGEKVTGATFGIYTDSTCKTVAKAYKSDTDSTLVNAEIIETATGVYTCNNLPISSATGTTYYVKELTAPEGYYLDTNVHAVTLKTANTTVSVSNEIGKSDFMEYPYGHATVIKEWKLDNSTADMTADEVAQMKAELEKSLYFTVKDSNGKYITATGADGVYTYNGESTSEFKYVLKNSTFTIAELPTGDYTITEYSTLLDYTIKSENPVKITVVRNQTATATFINERDTGNASIVKKWTNPNGLTSAQKAELEKNVYFTVKNADGAYLNAVSKNGKYVYNGSQTAEARFMLTNGKFELTELPTGKYTITEISNAEGYLPKTQVKTITVTKDATASAEFVNKVIVGNVTLTKVDEDYPENKLTGAVFTVYKSDKKTVVGTMKETETGVYSLEGLVYGEYYVQETKAPKYFVRDVNFYYFQIVNDGETVEVSNDELGKGTFINSPQKGEIKIVKTSYNNKVEGFKFEVSGTTYTGQTFKKTYTTDKDGIIRITDLRAGEYTIHEVKDSASAGYLLPEDKQLTIDRDGAMLVAKMHNDKIPDNPPTGAGEDGFMQTAVIIISTVMMSAAVVLAFPLSKRKRKR